MALAPLAILFDEPLDVPIRRDGTQSRFEMMSMASVEAIAQAIRELGLPDAHLINSAELFGLFANGRRPNFGLAMNLSSGLVNRWRYAQGPMGLELLRLPYSGSSLFTILICRDKSRCKALCREFVPIPPGVRITSERLNLLSELRDDLFPVIVKPNEEGGSVGVGVQAVIEDTGQLQSSVNAMLEDYPEGLVVESFISGTEVTSVIIGNGASQRIFPFALANRDGSSLPDTFLRTQEEKADAFATGDRTWFHLRETHGDGVAEMVTDISKHVADALELRDLARLDFRLASDGRIFFLEANAQPTFTPGNTSLYRCSQLVFQDPLGVEKAYIEAALRRTGLLRSDSAKG